jgi:hypothetical protein
VRAVSLEPGARAKQAQAIAEPLKRSHAFRLEALELPGRSLEPFSNDRPRGIIVNGGNAVTEFGLQVQHHLWPLLSETKAGAFNFCEARLVHRLRPRFQRQLSLSRNSGARWKAPATDPAAFVTLHDPSPWRRVLVVVALPLNRYSLVMEAAALRMRVSNRVELPLLRQRRELAESFTSNPMKWTL